MGKKVKKKLTKREKTLIYILIIFSITFLGGRYILIPSYNAWNKLKIEKNELELKVLDMEQKIDQIKTLKLEIDKINLNIMEATKDISPFLNDEDVDNMLTSLCIVHKLNPKNLSIHSNEYKKLNLKSLSDELYDFNEQVSKNDGDVDSPEDNSNKLLEEFDINIKKDELMEQLEDDEENEINDFYIRTAYITMEFGGKFDNMLEFVDDVNSIPYLSVLEYSSSLSEEMGELFQHKMVIKIIMINT